MPLACRAASAHDIFTSVRTHRKILKTTTIMPTLAGRWIRTLMTLALLASAHALAHDNPAPMAAPPTLAATGTVADVFVDNRLNGTVLRYIGLRLDDGRTFALAGVGLDALDAGQRIDVTGSLTGKTFNVSWFTRIASQGSGQVRAAAAPSPVTAVGALAIYHLDFFAEGRGEYGLAVRDDLGNITNVVVPAIPDSVAPNMRVSVDGTLAADGQSLDAKTITILAPPPAQQGGTAEAPITNTVLVIPIRFADSPGDSFTGAAVNTEFQTKVAPYYNEVSYGQQLLNVTVACTTTVLPGCTGRTNANGWLTSASNTPSGCNYGTMSNLATSVASAAGYDVSITGNKFVYVVLPGGSGCGWAGLAYVGYGLAYSANVNGLWVYGHELGHNFGLWHAGSTNCGAQVVGVGCSVSEYGDPFDVMGNIRQGHFNAMQKRTLNWIPSTSVKTHSSGTQTYQLSPIETGGQSTYAIKVTTSNANRTYWIEYRQPTGFDAFLSSLPNLGAQVRVAGPFESTGGSDDTQVLDMTPGSGGGFDDSALLATAPTYVDASTGVSIKVNSATPGTNGVLSVTVAMGGATSTTTALTSTPNPSMTVGTSVTFTATVTPVGGGGIPTGTVTFKDGSTTLGTGALNGAGVATFSTSALAAGTHSITAVYGGSGSFVTSTSPAYYQIVSVNSACSGYATTNANLVEGYYNTILQRASDATGKAFWTSEADRLCALGANPKQTFFIMLNSFFMGSEYLARNRSNTEFVTDLYSALFGRAPDGAGLSYWVGQLNSGMVRDNVMDYFLFSSEFTSKMNTAFPGNSARAETYMVFNLYGGLLRRLADTAGYVFWDGQLRTAQCSGNRGGGSLVDDRQRERPIRDRFGVHRARDEQRPLRIGSVLRDASKSRGARGIRVLGRATELERPYARASSPAIHGVFRDPVAERRDRGPGVSAVAARRERLTSFAG